jgi:hypothetical protein
VEKIMHATSALPSVARALLAALALTAIGQQLLLHIEASYNKLNFFSYFTNLSNLLAAFVLLLSAFTRSPQSPVVGVLRYVSAVNMAVVGIVFVVLLRNVDLGALLPWVNFVLHYVMPVAVVLDWLFRPPGARLRSKDLALALVFPAAYLAYVLLRGVSMGWYPYPFLNPAGVGGYGGVAMYSVGIFLTFLVVGSALLAAGTRTAAVASSSAPGD